MDNPEETACSSTPTVSRVDSDAPETCNSQPAPPGTEEIEFPFLKAVKTCEEPLIGLEFVLEQRPNNSDKSKFMCLLCNYDSDNINSIIQHLTSQKHYLTYLEQYFPRFYSAIESLKVNQVNKNNFEILVSHLIGKLMDLHELSRPTILRDSVLQIDSLKEIMLNNNHFGETPENESLKEMLKSEYIDDINLLQKNFPLKSKCGKEQDAEVLNSVGPENKITKAEESPYTKISAKLDSDCSNVSMDLEISSCCEESTDPSQQAVEVSNINAACSNQPEVTNSTKKVENTLPTTEKNVEIGEQSSKKIKDIDSNGSNVSKVVETIPKTVPQPCLGSEKSSSSRIPSKRRSRKDSPISHTSRSKFSRSRSRSPVRFPVLSKSSERRNYRRRSPSSSSSTSPRRYRSRSPSRRRRYSSSSYSSSSASSPRRGRYSSSKRATSRAAERRYCRDSYSYEYYEDVGEVKRGSRSKFHRSYERSLSPRSRRSPKRRSHSTSPGKRLRRMLAHETLSKNAGCVVRFDSSKSFSNSQNFDNVEGAQRKISRVTSEVRVEVKSTVNSEKSTENDKMNLFHKKIRVIKKRLRHERREFKKRPESYPTFDDEWKVFWFNRFKQIEAAGKEDPHNYDYRPDWTKYWLVRVKNLYKEKYKKMKLDLKKSLGVSGENESKKVANSDVVEISDGQESASPWEEETKNELPEAKTDCQKSSNSGLEGIESRLESKKENSTDTTLSTVTMQQMSFLTETMGISACMSSACSKSSTPCVESIYNSIDTQPASSNITKSDDSVDIGLKDDISIISVLRQLSVLESQLGSQAVLVTNLLANGLERERKQAGSSIRLNTHENQLFLNLIKEKLKGQLILEVVPDAMIKATKKCIKSIDDLIRVLPEPKLPDPRLAKTPEQKPSPKNVPASIASTTQVPFNPRNNFSPAKYTMPQQFPTTTVPSVNSQNSSARQHPAPQHSTPDQPFVSHPQYPARYESHPATVTHTILPATEYSMNSVNSINQVHYNAASATSMPPRQTISNQIAETPKIVPHPNQKTSAQRTSIQPTATGILPATPYPMNSVNSVNQGHYNAASATSIPPRQTETPKIVPHPNHTTSAQRTSVAGSSLNSPVTGYLPPATALSSTYESKFTKRPSIYDNIPWSEQASGTSIPSARPPSHSSTGDPGSRSSASRPSDPRLRSATSYNRSQIRPASSHSQTSSISSASHSRTLPVPSTTSNFPTVQQTSCFSDFSATSVNVPPNGSQLHSEVLAANHVNRTSMTSIPCNSVASTTSPATGNVSVTTTSMGSQMTSSSTPTVVNSSSLISDSIIDLTDDSPDYEENNEPINRLSESSLIELMKNFKQLPRGRQQEIVNFSRQLEDTNTNMALLENLKQYV